MQRMVLATLALVLGFAHCQERDETRQPGAVGPDVVAATVDLIRGTCVFADNQHFLRRLAFVESRNGLDLNATTLKAGGIWQVRRAEFEETKKNATLSALRQDVLDHVGVNWTTVQWADLQKPLYSALAAQLFSVLAAGAGGIPAAVEDQAVLWSGITGMAANDFVNAVQQLDKTGCQSKNPLDIAFAMDSSSSMSEAQFNTTKEFVIDLINQFDVAADRVRVGVVKFSKSVFPEFNLGDHLSKVGVISAVSNIRYAPGSTKTDAALDFIDMNMFTTAAGSRAGAAKVVVLLTDGQSDSTRKTGAAATRLKNSGAEIFTVGIGRTVDMAELISVASSPKCTHARSVATFNDLDTLITELQQIECEASIPLHPGNYEFSCGTVVTTHLISNLTVGSTVTLSASDGIVEVYGTASPGYTVSTALFSFHDRTHKDTPVQLFIRDNTPLSLVFRNATAGGCHANFTVKVDNGDMIFPAAAHVTCIEAGIISNCTAGDLVKSPFAIISPPGPELIGLQPCHAGKIEFFPHPYGVSKFIYCDGLILKVVYCPLGQVFNADRCELPTSGSALTTAATVAPSGARTTLAPIVGPTAGGSTPVRVTDLNLLTPCTAQHVAEGELTYPYPADKTRFIKCSSLIGVAYLLHCPPNRYYSHDQRTCLFIETVVNATEEVFVHLKTNPCVNRPSGIFFFPHPSDPHKFIQCDQFGDAFEKTCDLNEVWVPDAFSCIPEGFQYKPANIVG